MNHIEIARAFSSESEQDENNLALVLFGSTARGEERPDSDIDLLRLERRLPGLSKNEEIDYQGLKIGLSRVDYRGYRRDIIAAPYNKIILVGAEVLFDKTGRVQSWIEAIGRYFEANPDIKEEWDSQYALYRASKVDPSIKADNIYDLFWRNRVIHRGRKLQELIS